MCLSPCGVRLTSFGLSSCVGRSTSTWNHDRKKRVLATSEHLEFLGAFCPSFLFAWHYSSSFLSFGSFAMSEEQSTNKEAIVPKFDMDVIKSMMDEREVAEVAEAYGIPLDLNPRAAPPDMTMDEFSLDRRAAPIVMPLRHHDSSVTDLAHLVVVTMTGFLHLSDWSGTKFGYADLMANGEVVATHTTLPYGGFLDHMSPMPISQAEPLKILAEVPHTSKNKSSNRPTNAGSNDDGHNSRARFAAENPPLRGGVDHEQVVDATIRIYSTQPEDETAPVQTNAEETLAQENGTSKNRGKKICTEENSGGDGDERLFYILLSMTYFHFTYNISVSSLVGGRAGWIKERGREAEKRGRGLEVNLGQADIVRKKMVREFLLTFVRQILQRYKVKTLSLDTDYTSQSEVASRPSEPKEFYV
nr:hypothetical protein [Tanacetum cinerariifolium]